MTDDLQARVDAKLFPKVTLEQMEKRIKHTQYFWPENTSMTICIIILDSGFTVIGEAACADPRNFDMQIGIELSYKHAISKLWLAERLHNNETV